MTNDKALSEINKDVADLAAITDANVNFIRSTADQLVATAKFVNDFADMQQKSNERLSSMIGALCLLLSERGIATQDEIMQAHLRAIALIDQAAAAQEGNEM